MKIAVYGATGMIGSRVAAEARDRGHDVTPISRHLTDQPGARAGDAGDPAFARDVASAHDVVVSAIGPSRTEDDGRAFQQRIVTLVEELAGTRLLVVGGAGSLLVDGVALYDHPDFPEAYLAEARKQGEALDYLRSLPATVDWTYLSPAPEIAPGERTGSYTVGDDSPAGSSISAEDFAVALVDEIEEPAHRRARFTVATRP